MLSNYNNYKINNTTKIINKIQCKDLHLKNINNINKIKKTNII